MTETITTPAAELRAAAAEVMERHERIVLEGFVHCNYCGLEGTWPCDAHHMASALLVTLTALDVSDELESEIREAWYQARSFGTTPDWELLGGLSKKYRRLNTQQRIAAIIEGQDDGE